MIHHITAICKDAQKTTDFYTHVLGLRLVKLTVNQDDVGTYHLYFGDRLGRPGTVLTFFPWSYLPSGRVGPGMVSVVSFAAPSLTYWQKKLNDAGVKTIVLTKFGRSTLSFFDPDGLALEIVEHGSAGDWSKHVDARYAISGFFGATLMVESVHDTAQTLSHFGYVPLEKEDSVHRYVAEGSIIDIHEAPDASPGISGTGSVHHIAFRAKDFASQKKLREKLVASGLHLTESIDRYYFRSVYFREPGNILFEIATDDPGFTVDESEDTLGCALVLPPKFEPMRKEIEKILPKFTFPN